MRNCSIQVRNLCKKLDFKIEQLNDHLMRLGTGASCHYSIWLSITMMALNNRGGYGGGARGHVLSQNDLKNWKFREFDVKISPFLLVYGYTRVRFYHLGLTTIREIAVGGGGVGDPVPPPPRKRILDPPLLNNILMMRRKCPRASPIIFKEERGT